MEFLFATILLPAVVTGAAGALVIAGIYDIRRRRQNAANHMRSTWEITFRGEIKMEALYGFTHALSGLDTPRTLGPVHAPSFECYAAGTAGERFFVHLPGHMRERVDQWLVQHLDVEVDLVPADQDPVANAVLDFVVELEAGTGALDITDPIQQSLTVGSRFQHMAEDEVLITQIIVSPVRSRKEDDKLNSFNAIIRVGGSRPNRPDLMVADVVSGMQSLDNEHAYFRKRLIPNVANRLKNRTAMMELPSVLNERELITLFTWPLSGVEIKRAKRLAPTPAHDNVGVLVGTSNSTRTPGKPVCIPLQAFRTHIYINGPSGSGKTITTINLTLGAINAGMGAFVFDPKGGDLVRGVLRSTPDHRKDDVIWWDPMDKVAAIGFNPLKGDPEQVAAHMTSVMHILFKDSWGPRLEMYIKNIFTTASTAELSIYDSYMMLVNDDYRQNEVLRKVKSKLHPDTRAFWDLYDRGSDLAKDTVINKLDKICVSSIGRRVFSQQGGLDMADIMRKRQILLVPMNMAELGESNEAVGLLSQEMIINAAMRRSEEESKNTHLLVQDEYQHFAGISTNKFEPWAEVRSKGLGLIAANQYSRQLPKDVQETIGVNAATKIANRAGDAEDARLLAANFAPLKPDDFMALPQYTIAARLMSSGGIAPVVTLNATPPPQPTGFEDYIIERSRRLYGKPINEIEAEIEARHKAPEPRQRPVIGRRANPDETP